MRDLEPARYISPVSSSVTTDQLSCPSDTTPLRNQHEGAVLQLGVHNVHCGRAATPSLQSPSHPHTLPPCSHCSPCSPRSPSPPRHVHIVHRGQLGSGPHSPETSSPAPRYRDLQAVAAVLSRLQHHRSHGCGIPSVSTSC